MKKKQNIFWGRIRNYDRSFVPCETVHLNFNFEYFSVPITMYFNIC